MNSIGVSLLAKIMKVKKGGGHPLGDPCVPIVLLLVVHHCSLAVLSCLHSSLSVDSQLSRSSPCTTLVLLQKKVCQIHCDLNKVDS